MTAEDAIRRRRTEKVLAERDLPAVDRRAEVDEILALAGWAPFHRACDDSHRQSGLLDNDRGLTGIEPWRFHALDATACRRLRLKLPLAEAGKIPAMLSAADALVMATWLPNPGDVSPPQQSDWEQPSFSVTLANMEHIAAAAAAIQNLLLAATERGISNYWSSGGVLRLPEVFEMLGIPQTEILLGAIFLFPDQPAGAEVVGSKLRQRRTPPAQWSRWVNL